MPSSNQAEGVKSRKPANTAFKQQRLKAWQPILTPKTVLPTFFILGIIFVPLGAVLLHVSNQVDEMVIDYTLCSAANDQKAPKPDNVDSWSYDSATNVCTMDFTIKKTYKAPVFLYYRLTNFYQNHRRYVKSLSADQLRGDAVADPTDCDPLKKDANGLVYYPCGLIANSMFNDTIGVPSADFNSFTIQQVNGSPYVFSTKEISWPSDMQKYGPSQYDMSQVSPPRDWIGSSYRGVVLKNTWAASNITFNPQTDEHFQVWMRTAGLPTFRKLYGKNTAQSLEPGQYQIQIKSNFGVLGFQGTKSIVISTTSFLGGKNPFLGISYLVVGCICLILGIAFLVKHCVSPRKLGDHTYLSWNQNSNANAIVNADTPASADKRPAAE